MLFAFVCAYLLLRSTKENTSHSPQFLSSRTQSFSARIHVPFDFKLSNPLAGISRASHVRSIAMNFIYYFQISNKRSIVSKNRTLSGGADVVPL